MGSKYGFGKMAQAFNDSIKAAAIEIMQESKKYFGEAFEKEQLGDDKWDEVARRVPGTKYNKKQVVVGYNQPTGKTFVSDQGDDWQTRKILHGTTGELKRKTMKADSSITQNGAMSVMFNPVPYAQFSQDGTPYQPARPFMKQTDALTDIQLSILEKHTGKVWKIQP